MSKASEERSSDLIVEEFGKLVNMTPHALEIWLKTDESKEVGLTPEGSDESIGHQSGRHIVRMLHKPHGEWTADDVAHAHKVVGYIKRHVAQGGPHDDKAHSRWAYSLKNWGHDPAKHA